MTRITLVYQVDGCVLMCVCVDVSVCKEKDLRKRTWSSSSCPETRTHEMSFFVYAHMNTHNHVLQVDVCVDGYVLMCVC